MKHEPTVMPVEDTNSFIFSCPCGTVGEARAVESLAEQDGRIHKLFPTFKVDPSPKLMGKVKTYARA